VNIPLITELRTILIRRTVIEPVTLGGGGKLENGRHEEEKEDGGGREGAR